MIARIHPLTTLLPAVATAEPISPKRYIDSQGVEVIQNRSAAVPVSRVCSVTPIAITRSPINLTTSGSVDRDIKLHVSAAQQSERDRDRVAILKQELNEEMQILASLSKQLAGTGATTNASDAASIRERLNDHQKNIEALHGELRRTKSAL